MSIEKVLKKLAVLAFLAVAGWLAYQQWLAPFAPLPSTDFALLSNADVVVETEPFLTFSPADQAPKAGFIIYPGARVPPEAYAELANAIADQGFLVVVPSMPFGFAFLGESKADEVRKEHPEISNWAIGGHSLGGAMAASFSDSNSQMDALVLMAAYPGDTVDLSLRSIDVLVLYGSEDELATPAEVESAVNALPEDAVFVVIQGGNHAQFASYGSQSGDGLAAITPQEQQAIIVSEVVKVLRAID